MKDIEPFLELFQAERPLTIFLHEKWRPNMLLLEKVVDVKILQESSSTSKLMELDLQNMANLLSETSIDIAFGANAALKNLSTTEAKD